MANTAIILNMTREEKLTQIEKVIRECNSELQELTFGCEILYEDLQQIDVDDFCDVIAKVVGKRDLDIIVGYTKNKTMYEREYTTFVYSDEQYCKVIGHPIQLQHILRAMPITGYPNMQLQPNGILQFRTDEAHHWNPEYKLTLPLHLQSDEFISWLHEILCNN